MIFRWFLCNICCLWPLLGLRVVTCSGVWYRSVLSFSVRYCSVLSFSVSVPFCASGALQVRLRLPEYHQLEDCATLICAESRWRHTSQLCFVRPNEFSALSHCWLSARCANGDRRWDSDTELQIPDVPESFKGSLYCCPDCKAMSAVSRSDDSVVTCSTQVCVHTRPLHSIAVRCRYSCVIVTNAGVLATWSLSAHSRTTMGCVQLSICVVST